MKILLIDDEPFVLKLLARQIDNLGFPRVVSCERAEDALALVQDDGNAPDLIFLDLQMPGMDGVEFLRHLVGVGFRGKLVLISGEDARILQTAEKLAEAHGIDVLGALLKPISTEQLRRIMDIHRAHAAPSPRGTVKNYGAEEVRQAIRGGELVVHYQPQAKIGTGEIVGVEALVRWQHPQDGLVFPDQFIPTAEDHTLIDDLTRWVLTDALRQARIWHASGLALDISVNVSMDNLTELQFPEFVAAAVAEAGIPIHSLMLEVTESRLMKDHVSSLDILTRLRLRRVGLSIDDFGTGHSSLKQLRDIPFDELKVDQGFVHDACSNPSLRAIVDASIGVARQLGIRTVAEGVENAADWAFLRLTPCDRAQGYFISKAMPGEDIGPWIEGWEERRSELMRAKA